MDLNFSHLAVTHARPFLPNEGGCLAIFSHGIRTLLSALPLLVPPGLDVQNLPVPLCTWGDRPPTGGPEHAHHQPIPERGHEIKTMLSGFCHFLLSQLSNSISCGSLFKAGAPKMWSG